MATEKRATTTAPRQAGPDGHSQQPHMQPPQSLKTTICTDSGGPKTDAIASYLEDRIRLLTAGSRPHC